MTPGQKVETRELCNGACQPAPPHRAPPRDPRHQRARHEQAGRQAGRQGAVIVGSGRWRCSEHKHIEGLVDPSARALLQHAPSVVFRPRAALLVCDTWCGSAGRRLPAPAAPERAAAAGLAPPHAARRGADQARTTAGGARQRTRPGRGSGYDHQGGSGRCRGAGEQPSSEEARTHPGFSCCSCSCCSCCCI